MSTTAPIGGPLLKTSARREVALGEVIELISGQHIDVADYNADGRGVPYLTGPSDFGELNPTVTRWTEYPKKTARKGDVLLTVKGSGVGKTNVLNIDEAAISRQIMAVRAKDIDARFLAFVLAGYAEHFRSLANGAAIPGISREDVTSLRVSIPPLDEQKRIVAALDQAFAALDRARANAEANLADAEALFDAWLTQLFRERPPTWRTERLHALCDQITVGHVGPMADRYSARGIPFLRSQNIRPFEISMIDVKSIDEQFHGELAKSALRPGDVAIVRTGYPGTAAVIPSSLPVSNCADLVIARPGELISPDFLVMFLNSSFGKTLVAEKSVGAAQKHFNVGAAREAELPFPDRAEQDRLVRLAAERREVARGLSEAYRVKQSDIAELRQSLLRAAFSGQMS